MSKKTADLVSKLKQLNSSREQILSATVGAVNKTNNTIDVSVDGLVFYGVRIKPVVIEGMKSLFIYPALDSQVLIGMIRNSNQYYLASVSEVEQIVLQIGTDLELTIDATSAYFSMGNSEMLIEDTGISLTADAIQLNDGAFGGLIKVSQLVQKINALENDLNTLKTVFNSWITVPNDGGAALKTAAATWAGSTITNTVVQDLENNKITHG